MQRSSARTWVRAAAIMGGVVLTAAAVIVGSVVVRYRSIDRERFSGGTLTPVSRGEPRNFLVVGTDSRQFVHEPGDAASFGTADEVGAPAADTILLVRTFPALNRVAMVSFPRDLHLTIAGTATEGRINTALEGGADRLVRTITESFGVPVHHYLEIDFQGFRALVDAIGGVTINFPAPARDWDEQRQLNPTGLDIARTGCVELGGQQALAWVRSRHYQQFMNGTWQADPAGDLNRTMRQQEFIRKTVGQSAARGLRSPARLNSLINVAVQNVTLDDQLGLRDLTALSRQFRSVRAESLQSYALPTFPGRTANGADVLFLDGPAAESVLDVFRGKSTSAETLLPSAVRVRVLHSAARAGAGDAAAFRLAAAGFVLVPSAVTDGPTAKTVIEYTEGAQDKAELLRARLVGPAELRVSPSLEGVDMVLTIGQDWRGVTDNAAPPASTTVPPSDAGAEPGPAPGQPQDAPSPSPACP